MKNKIENQILLYAKATTIWFFVITIIVVFSFLVIKGSAYHTNSSETESNTSQTSTELVSYENDFYVIDTCTYNSTFVTVWKSIDETKGLVIQDENLYWKVVGTNSTYNFEIQMNKTYPDYNEVLIKIGEDTYRGKMYDIGE